MLLLQMANQGFNVRLGRENMEKCLQLRVNSHVRVHGRSLGTQLEGFWSIRAGVRVHGDSRRGRVSLWTLVASCMAPPSWIRVGRLKVREITGYFPFSYSGCNCLVSPHCHRLLSGWHAASIVVN